MVVSSLRNPARQQREHAVSAQVAIVETALLVLRKLREER
jgi:hypothetical protein